MAGFAFAAMVAGFGVKKKKKKKMKANKKKNMKIERQCQSCAWSNLPGDIICVIMNRLYYIDQIRFRAVCKGWREANIQGVVISADKLPWNMAIDSNSCHLYDPSHKQKYTIETSITRTGIFINANVLASKYGWVLIAKTEDARFIMSTNAKIFFYNPFTNRIIQLPDFHIWIEDKATFTSAPDSPDCQVFVVRAFLVKISIFLCKPGDTSWSEMIKFPFSKFPFDMEYESDGPVSDIEYVDGVIYTSYYQSAVISYNVALKKWRKYPYPPCERNDSKLYDYLIESDGTLLLCHDESDKYPVFRLDTLQKNWIRVGNLDNRSLFLGDYTSVLIPVDEKSELVNTIHSERCHHSPRCPKLSKLYDLKFGDNFWIQPPQLK